MGELWQVASDLGLFAAGWKAIGHFLLSGFAGLLAYRWMSTILLLSYSGSMFGPHLRKDAFGIPRYLWLLAVSFAIWCHVVEDYIINIF